MPAGWTLSNISCTAGSPTIGVSGNNASFNGTFDAGDNSVKVTVGANDDTTCTFTNTQQTGTLIVKKHVVNNNGGTKTAADFSLHVKSAGTDVATSPAAGSETGTSYSLAAGTYVVSENAPPSGYTQTGIAGDCNGSGSVTVTPGTTVTCTITNDDQAATLTVIKHVINNSGGTSTASNFTMNVTGGNVAPNASFNGAESPGTTVTLDAGAYSVAETGPSGYNESDSVDCSGTIANGVTKTCTITNDDKAATLIVIKHVINNNGGTKSASDFTMNVTGGSATPASSAGADTPGTTVTLNAGSYSVAETGPSGYTESDSVDCSGTIANGQTKTCTITNDDKAGTLIVIKHVINNSGGTKAAADFTMNVTGTNIVPNASFAGAESPGSTVTLNAGSYSVAETGPSGYTESDSVDCSGSIANGVTKTCTITNDDKAGTLIVIKHVINNSGGTKAAADFTMDVTGGHVAPNASFAGAESPGTTVTLDAGSYSVAETGPSGYAESDSSDCSGTIANGVTKTCTITNDDVAATLIVIKHVINNDGGTKAAADFTMNVTGGSATPASSAGAESPGTTVTLNAGSYSVAETGPSGYTESDSADCSGTIANGVTKTCTITNNDKPGTLVVIKHVINNNGGNKAAADFTMNVTGTNVAPNASFAGAESPGSTVTLNAGSYSVAETGPSGYTESDSVDCSGTIANGVTKTCTITNDDKAGTLIVIKHVINNDGGAAVASDFTMGVTGGHVAPNASFAGAESPGTTVTLDAGSYSVAETGPSGYTESDSADCSGTIANGVTKTCTITNDDKPGTLIVIKHVINNNGGTKAAADFTMNVTGGHVAPNASFAGAESPGTTVTLDAGSYSVAETGPSGYTEADSADCFGAIANGVTKTCTITNDDKAGTLIVIKHVINNSGGSKAAADFTMGVTGGHVAPNASFAGAESPGTTVTLDAGAYSVAETGPSGYTESDSADCSGTIANGVTKTCTITNDDKPGTLIVIKHVINNNGGTKAAADFTMGVTGGHVAPNASFAGAESPGTTVTLDAGSYSVAETGPSGYAETDSADCSGTIANGVTKTCTVTNDDIAGKLIVIKHVVQNNGGTAVASDFTMTVTGTNPNPANFPGDENGTNVTLDAGSYSVSESGPTGYAEVDSADCKGTIAIGETKGCLVTNDDQTGTILVIKHVINDDGGNAQASDFTLATNGTNPSPASFAGDENGTTVTVDAGAYNVSETGPSGYTESDSADCTGNITVGQLKVCTVTNNDKPGTLTVIKHVINNDGGAAKSADFTMNVTGANVAPAASFAGAEAPGTVVTLDAGSYSVAESGPSGYTESDSADCSGTIANGVSKTCTITNDDQAGTLTVIKHVVNNDGGAAQSSDFKMTVTGAHVAPSATFDGADTPGTVVTLDAGAYSVAETGPSGYTESDSADCTGTIANGVSKTCTITNDDQAGKLIVIKHVVNNDGGAAQSSDFTMSVTGTHVAPSATFPGDDAPGTTVTLDAGSYSVAETGLSGYSESDSADCAGTIANGATKTCTITNDDVAGKLIVIKHVDNGIGGTSVASDFTMNVTGGHVAPSAAFAGAEAPGTTVTLDAGNYSVAETGPVGYAETDSADCAGAIANGETKTCTVTNTANSNVSVVKNELGIPTTNQYAFTLTGGPGNISVSLTTNSGGNTHVLDFGVLPAGTYTLCETVPVGYGSDLGTPANPCETFTLHVGENKVFTVDNTPCPAGALTIDSTLVPDMLQGAETVPFTFDVTGPNGFATTAHITFHAHDTHLTTLVTVPRSGTYTVSQLASSPFPANSTTVDILPAGCAGTALFAPSFTPPQVEVIETTIPAGYESGWHFTLKQGGSPLNTLDSVGPGAGLFPDALGEGNFSVVQTAQPGWAQSAVAGCNFNVNLPGNAGGLFVCKVVNVAVASVTVIKTEQTNGRPHPAQGHWRFSLDGGNNQQHASFSLKMNTAGRTNRINFGKSVPIGNYTICETRFGAWKSSLLGQGGFINAHGDSCLAFALKPGQHKIVRVNNQCTATTAAARRLPQ